MPFLPVLAGCLQRCGRLQLDNDTLSKLLKLSASTAERILKRERKERQKNPSLTKVGNLLRKHIEIRTFDDWNERTPGFIEADTVGHHGGNIRGAYIHSLTLTDIATGWTEVVPVLHKTEHEALEGFKTVRNPLPFALRGIDTDNGSEFMNYKPIDWCEKEQDEPMDGQPLQETAETASVQGPQPFTESIQTDEKQTAPTTIDTVNRNRRKPGRPPKQNQFATGARAQRPSMLQVVIEDVFSEFLKREVGEVLLAKDLLHCGKPHTVRVAIMQLSERGLIANCGWGKYTRIKDAAALAVARADKRTGGLAVPIRNHFLSRPDQIVDVQDLLAYGPSARVRAVVSRLKRHGFIEHCGLAQYSRPTMISTKNLKPLKIQRSPKNGAAHAALL